MSTSKIGIKNKICAACQQFMSVQNYRKDSRSHDGFHNICKECLKNGRSPVKKTTHKECKQCLRFMPVSDFDPSKKHKDGYGNKCKECKDYNQKSAVRRWQKEHPESMNQRSKTFREENPAYMKAYYHREKEKIEEKRKSPTGKSKQEVQDERIDRMKIHNEEKKKRFKQQRDEITRQLIDQEEESMIYPGPLSIDQQAILQDTSKRVAVLHGRRAGISTAFFIKIEQFLRYNPNSRVLYVAPCDSLATRAKKTIELFLDKRVIKYAFDDNKTILENKCSIYYTDKKSDFILELIPKYDLIVIEDFDYISDSYTRSVIKDARDDASLYLYSSVHNKNSVLTDIFEHKIQPNFSVYQVPGGLCIPDKVQESLQGLLSETMFNQEMLAEF